MRPLHHMRLHAACCPLFSHLQQLGHISRVPAVLAAVLKAVQNCHGRRQQLKAVQFATLLHVQAARYMALSQLPL